MAVAQVVGDFDGYSSDAAGDRVHLHTRGDWLSLVRRLYRAGCKIQTRRVSPYSDKDRRGWITLGFTVSGVPVKLYADVPDFTRFLKPGATCSVVPQSFQIVCQ